MDSACYTGCSGLLCLEQGGTGGTQTRRKNGAEIEEKLKYEARLRKEYAVLTADVITDASQDTLLDGVVCHLQQRLEKQRI